MDGDAASPLTAHTVLHVGLTQLPESRVEPTALVLVEAGCGVPQVWHEQLVDGADRGHGSIKGCLYERKFTERAHGYDKKLKLKMSKQGIYKGLENRAVDPLFFLRIQIQIQLFFSIRIQLSCFLIRIRIELK